MIWQAIPYNITKHTYKALQFFYESGRLLWSTTKCFVALLNLCLHYSVFL